MDSLVMRSTSFNCPVCADVFEDAVAFPCCHRFCHGCVDFHADKFACPTCTRPCPVESVMACPYMRNLVSNYHDRIAKRWYKSDKTTVKPSKKFRAYLF